MSAMQLKNFQKFLFLCLGTCVFGRKLADILPILTQKRSPPTNNQSLINIWIFFLKIPLM
jgi:hypothetical protein